VPLNFWPVLRLKLLQACDQWHSSRVSTTSYRYHRKRRSCTEGRSAGCGYNSVGRHLEVRGAWCRDG
jgi:hypothetical protein